jgi:hypothetical protein
MARRRSLAGSLGGSLAGSLSDRSAGGGAPAPPSFTGIVDALIAAGETVNFAVSCGYQLTTAGGQKIRVREAGGNTEADIAVDTTTHLLDSAALAAHCGASDGFIVTLYDRSGNTRDFTNATAGEQPKIYDGATGVVLAGSLPVAALNGGAAGAAGEGDGWVRGDGAGFVATGAVCVFYFGSFTDVATHSRVAMTVGTSTTQGWSLRHPIATGLIGIGRSGGSTDGAVQSYTAATALSSLSGYVAHIGAGTPALSTSSLRQRGAALVQSGTQAGTMNLLASSVAIGSTATQALGVTGQWSCAIGLAALPGAPGLALLDAFEQTLRTTAGV